MYPTDEGLNELDCGAWVGKPFPELKESESNGANSINSGP